MDSMKKYAVLDTDFLFKSHIAQKDNANTLANLIIQFRDYKFICHEMILEELGRHQITPDPLPWLNLLIQQGKVQKYTDADIINQLKPIYGKNAASMYTTMLETSCNTFTQNFFAIYYASLKNLSVDTSDEVFLQELSKCDQAIPHQNGVGEKKSYVLVQMMQTLAPGRVYVFCSDDFPARQSLSTLPDPINCLSILGIFRKLKMMGYEKGEIKIYYTALTDFLSMRGQTTFRVWSQNGYSRIKVPVDQVFEDIFDGKFDLLRNGDLKYR